MKSEKKLSRELADLSFALIEIIKQEFRANAKPGGPTMAQFKLLCMIREGVQHVGKLAEAFGISQPATSKMVDLMVKEGFLKRVPHSTDRRQIELHLTKQATTAIDVMYEKALLRIDGHLKEISPSKKKEITTVIKEVSQILSNAKKVVP